MSDNYLEMLLKELQKNGVSLRKLPFNPDKFTVDELEIEAVQLEPFNFLDFSEHEKVFEDKIAKLEKQIDRLNEEKSFLRTRCMPYVEKDFDNRLYGKLAIVSCNEEFVDIRKYADGDDLYSIEVRNLISEGGIKRLIGQYRNLSSRLDKMSAENKELKQRIVELEDKIGDRDEIKRCLLARAAELKSKESAKPMRIEFYADNGEPFTPLEVANSLINQNTFKVDELRELAEHLQVYCRHHNDKKEDVISF